MNKKCFTCGEILPEEKFPLKHSGRREAECEGCLNKEPLVKQRPKILGISPKPPNLGKLHARREVVTTNPVNHRKKVEIKRAVRIWENQLHKFSTGRGWYSVKEAEEEVMYSTPVVREILNNLVNEGFLEKKTVRRSRLYRLKENQVNLLEIGVVSGV